MSRSKTLDGLADGNPLESMFNLGYEDGYEQGKRDAVVHSYWDYEDENDTVAHCHNCGNGSDWETPYCPYCCACMDGERKDGKE